MTRKTEEYVDEASGVIKVRTVEYVEKLIEKEVQIAIVNSRRSHFRCACSTFCYEAIAVFAADAVNNFVLVQLFGNM